MKQQLELGPVTYANALCPKKFLNSEFSAGSKTNFILIIGLLILKPFILLITCSSYETG